MQGNTLKTIKHLNQMKRLTSLPQGSTLRVVNYLKKSIFSAQFQSLRTAKTEKTTLDINKNECSLFTNLPDNILIYIFNYLGVKDKLFITQTSIKFAPINPVNMLLQSQALGTKKLQEVATNEAREWVTQQLSNHNQISLDLIQKIEQDHIIIPGRLVKPIVIELLYDNAIKAAKRIPENHRKSLIINHISKFLVKHGSIKQIFDILNLSIPIMDSDYLKKNLILNVKDRLSVEQLVGFVNFAIRSIKSDYILNDLISDVKDRFSSDQLVDLFNMIIPNINSDFYKKQLILDIKDRLSGDQLVDLLKQTIQIMVNNYIMKDLILGVKDSLSGDQLVEFVNWAVQTMDHEYSKKDLILGLKNQLSDDQITNLLIMTIPTMNDDFRKKDLILSVKDRLANKLINLNSHL